MKKRRNIPAWAIALLVIILLVFGLIFYYSSKIYYSPGEIVVQDEVEKNEGFCSIEGVLAARTLHQSCASAGDCDEYNRVKAEYLEECGWELP